MNAILWLLPLWAHKLINMLTDRSLVRVISSDPDHFPTRYYWTTVSEEPKTTRHAEIDGENGYMHWIGDPYAVLAVHVTAVSWLKEQIVDNLKLTRVGATNGWTFWMLSKTVGHINFVAEKARGGGE